MEHIRAAPSGAGVTLRLRVRGNGEGVAQLLRALPSTREVHEVVEEDGITRARITIESADGAAGVADALVGGGHGLLEMTPETVSLEHASSVSEELGRDLVAIHNALSDFEAVDPTRAKVVELRFFAGFTSKETADVLECSERTVRRHWKAARLWLYHELSGTRDRAP